jgi:hypothetical protein
VRERIELQHRRESQYLGAELRRVALVSGTCLGLLAVLTIIDRLG